MSRGIRRDVSFEHLQITRNVRITEWASAGAKTFCRLGLALFLTAGVAQMGDPSLLELAHFALGRSIALGFWLILGVGLI